MTAVWRSECPLLDKDIYSWYDLSRIRLASKSRRRAGHMFNSTTVVCFMLGLTIHGSSLLAGASLPDDLSGPGNFGVGLADRDEQHRILGSGNSGLKDHSIRDSNDSS